MTRLDHQPPAGVLNAADRFDILAGELGTEGAASLLSGEYRARLRETVKELGRVCTAAREVRE